jgi:hypothetical protein
MKGCDGPIPIDRRRQPARKEIGGALGQRQSWRRRDGVSELPRKPISAGYSLLADSPLYLGLVVQNGAQKRIVDFNFSVVVDEPQFAEFVHEETDAGSGGADHLCQGFLADIRIDWAFLSEMREQKEKAREALLARVEQLVDQVFFNSAVARQEIRHEHLGKFRLGVKEGNDRFLRYRGDHAFFHRRCGRDALRMAVKAPLSEELTGFQNCNHRFLSLLGQDSELDPTLLNVEYRIGGISLRENILVLLKFENRFPGANLGEKHFRIKRVLGLLPHQSLLSVTKPLNFKVRDGYRANPALVGVFISPRDTVCEARFAAPSKSPLRSGAEEREPDHAEDQYRQPGRDGEEGKHRRPWFGLARFGRGFNDLALLSRCHGALDFLMSRTPCCAYFESNA